MTLSVRRAISSMLAKPGPASMYYYVQRWIRLFLSPQLGLSNTNQSSQVLMCSLRNKVTGQCCPTVRSLREPGSRESHTPHHQPGSSFEMRDCVLPGYKKLHISTEALTPKHTMLPRIVLCRLLFQHLLSAHHRVTSGHLPSPAHGLHVLPATPIVAHSQPPLCSPVNKTGVQPRVEAFGQLSHRPRWT